LLTSLAGVVVSLAFLAVGFHVADTNTPSVTVAEASGTCSTKPDCRH
jgi:hypothetical protein